MLQPLHWAMAGLSSMLSRGISRRQLSSLQNQCEALERGIEEAQAERLRCWTCAERQRSEAAEMDPQMQIMKGEADYQWLS